MRGGKEHGRERRVICGCSKICYTKRDAQAAINRAQGHTRASKRPIRFYQCPRSNMWHLTSHEETDYEDRQEKPLILEGVWKKVLKQAKK